MTNDDQANSGSAFAVISCKNFSAVCPLPMLGMNCIDFEKKMSKRKKYRGGGSKFGNNLQRTKFSNNVWTQFFV